jgi:YD repeat-containing protein
MNPRYFGIMKLCIAGALVLGLSAGKIGAATTLTFTYDALGRLTYVVDPVNGNRDYDYDKMGNRLNVATSTASDAASEPPPPSPPGAPNPPTNLSQTLMYDCNWIAQWSPPGGQTSYQFKDSRNPERTVLGGNTSTGVVCDQGNPSSNKAVYIKACNATACSTAAYFP